MKRLARLVIVASMFALVGAGQVLGADNLLQNPSLETATGSTPSCWLLGGYGTNTFAWTRAPTAHSRSFAENLVVTSVTSGDRKLVSAQDGGQCAPAAVPAIPTR